jgi:MHS family proline/betaine transporter-like MFS transporter
LPATAAPAAGSDAESHGRSRAIAAASVGNMLEWYDFTVYALFAPYIARNFFPGGEPAADLLKAFLAFGLGFVVRPLGAILIGNYGDRAGRKAALTLTIGLMAAGTAAIALAPGYGAIGLGAALLLVVGRVLQGFSAGGEIGGAAAFLLENAPPGRRGITTSWLEASMGLSNILGALAALLVTGLLSIEQVQDWGWRVPFLVGLLILPAGWYLRRTLHETDAFRAETDLRRSGEHTSRSPLIEILAHHKLPLLVGFGMSVLWAVGVYVLIVFVPVYVQITFHFSATQAFGASLAGNVFFVAGCLIFGAVSDRIGRRATLLISALLMFASIVPLFMWLRASPSTATLICAQSAFCILVASYVGVAPAALSGLFPTGVRSTGTSIVYNTAFTIFGGFAPAILTWLTQRAGGSVLAPAWYVMMAAAVAAIAIPFVGERR